MATEEPTPKIKTIKQLERVADLPVSMKEVLERIKKRQGNIQPKKNKDRH